MITTTKISNQAGWASGGKVLRAARLIKDARRASEAPKYHTWIAVLHCAVFTAFALPLRSYAQPLPSSDPHTASLAMVP